jgi:hypothetical protein
MASSPTEITINNKSVPVFTMKNLESMNPQNLRMRGLDLKDLLTSMGAGEVVMPRHQEELRDWIISTQNSLLGMGGAAPGAPAGQRMPQPSQGRNDMFMDQMRPSPESRGPPPGYAPSETAYTDAEDAFAAARAGRMASKNRNQGSSNIISWA